MKIKKAVFPKNPAFFPLVRAAAEFHTKQRQPLPSCSKMKNQIDNSSFCIEVLVCPAEKILKIGEFGNVTRDYP
jgi:hypothetical protein